MKTVAGGHVALNQNLLLIVLSVAPCAIAFGQSAWPSYAAWAALAGLRLRYEDRKVVRDCVLFGLLTSLLFRHRIVETISTTCDPLVRGRGSWAMNSAAALAALVAVGYLSAKNNNDRKLSVKALATNTKRWTLEHPKAFIIPCRTTHTRIFPKKHGFGYNYLLCGFPIVPGLTTPEGMNLPDGEDKILGRWWLHIRADDYLARGQADLGFYGKLKVFLRERGVKDSEWSYAYLVTAPRFFGYAFNPASFWYIYNREHELIRMITEVNNTFGERHIYLLDGSSPTSPPQTPDEELPVPPTTKKTFADYWTKEFHVSPFNSRKGGGYAQKAVNPFPTPNSTPAIDITITLKSSKDHAKLIARLFKVGPATEIEALSWTGILNFITTWGWVGFMTFPRILKEAYTLYFHKGLRVWFRPEVRASSLGRLPSETERFLQKIFRNYISYLVHYSTEPFMITYDTAIPNVPKDVITTTQRRDCERNVQHLDVRVLTGAFYSRFVHYAHTWEALDRECLFTDEKNRTLWLSQPALLPLLLPNSTLQQLKTDEALSQRGYFDELRWTVLRKLRCPPAEPAYPISPKSVNFEADDIREHAFSELDRFIRAPSEETFAGTYRRMVTKLFLAQRYAWGFPEIIDMFDLCIRLVLCWLAAHLVGLIAQDQNHFHSVIAEFSWLSKSLLVGLCHVYGLSKGYR